MPLFVALGKSASIRNRTNRRTKNVISFDVGDFGVDTLYFIISFKKARFGRLRISTSPFTILPSSLFTFPTTAISPSTMLFDLSITLPRPTFISPLTLP